MVLANMPNKIGMSVSSWSRCFKCKAPHTCTNTSLSTWQTSFGDQMSQYRDTHIAETASNANISCSFLPGLPNSYSSPTLKSSLQSLSCNLSTSFLSVALTLSGKTVGLVLAPQLPQLELVDVFGTWSQNCTLTTLASNIGHSSGNFSVIVKQCCLRMADLTTRCFNRVNKDLLYTNDHDWLVAPASETITVRTTIAVLSDDGFVMGTPNSRSFSCDMMIGEATNLTTLSYFFSVSNGYAIPPISSNQSPELMFSSNLKAVAFDTYFESASIGDQNVLTAR